jgi:mannose-6-phosphate isomerase
VDDDLSEDQIMAQILQDERPWGNFRRFAHNQTCTVKILTVEAGGTLSLQSHRSRDELWIVLDEGLRVQIDDDVFDPKPKDEFIIMRGQKHRLSSVGSAGRILEVAFGYFDEDDIERYEDVYGR